MVTPSSFLAHCIAMEWDQQQGTITQNNMHLTSLAFTALDNASGLPRAQRTDILLDYLRNDTVLYRQDIPEALFVMQCKHWDALSAWFQQRFGATLTSTMELGSVEQTPQTVTAVRAYVDGLSTWSLEGLYYAAESARSIIVAMALIEGHVDAEQATFLSRLETEYQVCES